jgi:L-iditol 2-dehydrogenase
MSEGKMLAAVYHGVGKIKVEEVDKPPLPPGGLLVKVSCCAICGTDYKLLNTENPRFKPPLIIGHEFVGQVVEKDAQVSDFEVGERVTMATTISCGRCELCHRGLGNLCESRICVGTDISGAMAQYLAIPALALERGNVLKVPGNLSDEAASLSEPLGCAVNAQLIAGVGLGQSVVIVGAGPLGFLQAELARANGALKVYLTQRSEPRLSLAQKLAVDGVIDASAHDPVSEVRRLTQGQGADVVIVTAPNPKAQGEALAMAKKGGVVNLFASLPQDSPYLSINSRLIHYGQISLTGASDSTPYHQKIALELLARGKINTEAIITHRFPLKELERGFEVMREKVGLKVLIYCT